MKDDEPTMELRFVEKGSDGGMFPAPRKVLQQKWITYEREVESDGDRWHDYPVEVWRDVPLEEEK